MVAKILKKDFLRKKIITIVVFAFILLSALLVASGSNLIVELSNSLNALFATSNVPHFVQMHAGEIDQAEIDRWAAANRLVKAQQTVEMITIDGTSLYLGESQSAEENSIMDISFVKQNTAFDFLLDLENQIIQVSPGEIAVPIYYMQRDDLKPGDTVRVSTGSFDVNFIVAAFVRDAQMNPAVVHSKRFMVHEADYATLRKHFHETEYLVEFLLTDAGQVGEFSQTYLSSNLPKKGPAVDYRLFKALNGLTDGIVAGVVIVLSLLLIIIALLCLRSLLFLLACLPVLIVWQGSQRRLFITLSSALFILVGGLYMLQSYWFPLSMRVAHSLEILADSFVYTGVVILLLRSRLDLPVWPISSGRSRLVERMRLLQ